MEICSIEKPSDWPRNNRETNLDIIYEQVQNLIESPNYKIKEVLFSLLDPTEMNEINEMGEVHICDYEIALMNELYQIAISINCVSLKSYLYGHISRYTRLHRMYRNMSRIMGTEEPLEISEYSGLVMPLKLFYFCYADYDSRKNRAFVDSIVDMVKRLFSSLQDESDKLKLVAGYNLMLQDLGFTNSNAIFPFLCFNRSELKRLFELSAELNKKTGKSIIERPLKGVIKVSLRQWILKSRNDYDSDILYKAISITNTAKAFSNHEVWMSKTIKLNDKREQKIIRELFNNKAWLRYDWAKKISIRELTDSFVCSFSKAMPSKKMQRRYGGVTFGYKSDRIADILSPMLNRTQVGLPYFDQVVFYDIIYDVEEARKELNYLCELIDLYNLTEQEKTSFLDELLEYWYLSFKDKKWSEEKERRYQLFIFEDDDYYDLVVENNFLKIKSTLYLYPDFIITESQPLKIKGRLRRMEKLSATATRNYVFCEDCFQSDFTAGCLSSFYNKCPVCGSKNIVLKQID